MNFKDEITFNLIAGEWKWWFQHIKTLKKLTPVNKISLNKENTKITFFVPEALKKKKKVAIVVQRIR
jgi:hypothetical protein